MLACNQKNDITQNSIKDTVNSESIKDSPSKITSRFLLAYINKDNSEIDRLSSMYVIKGYALYQIDKVMKENQTEPKYQVKDEVIVESNIIRNGKRLNNRAVVNILVNQEFIGVYLIQENGEWKILKIDEPQNLMSIDEERGELNLEIKK